MSTGEPKLGPQDRMRTWSGGIPSIEEGAKWPNYALTGRVQPRMEDLLEPVAVKLKETIARMSAEDAGNAPLFYATLILTVLKEVGALEAKPDCLNCEERVRVHA